ncbi:hypothetical protein Tco_1315902 [Tanacetum coccineum]
MSWYLRCSWCGGPFNGGNCRRCTNVSFGDEFVRNPDPISYDETPDFSYPPPQPQYETYSCELCGNDSHYGYDCPPRVPLESTIPLNEITSQIPPITPVLPIEDLEDSPIIGDENLTTIPEKESDEFIKSSVENLVPILSESEDTSGSDSECDLPSCNDFSPINISEEKSVTFSNPLFDSNDDFTSSDDESLSDEDVPKDNFRIYSNPLFKFEDEYISSDVNPLFDEVLEDIESEDSYVSKLDESDLLVTPLSKLNEDECFDPGGDILLLEKSLNDDPSSPLHPKKFNFEELKDTIPNLPPEVFLDRDPRSLEDEPNKDDLKNIVKVFHPGMDISKITSNSQKRRRRRWKMMVRSVSGAFL